MLMKENNFRSSFCNLSTCLICLFIFSRISWGFIIPKAIWGISIVLVGLISSLFILDIILKIKNIELSSFLIILMTIIMIFNRNYDLKSEGIFEFAIDIFPTVCCSLLYIVCVYNYSWIESFKKLSIIMGTLYGFCTLIFIVIPQLYYSFVLPLLKSKYSQIMAIMSPTPKAGLFADYGTNSIYMGFAFIISFAYVYSKRKNNFSNRKVMLLCVIFSGLGILLNMKRTTIVGLLISFTILFVTFEYKRDKYFRLILIFLCTSICGLLLIMFIPSLSDITQRFSILFEDQGDSNVSTRYVMWKYAVDGFKEAPLFGKGWRWVKHSVNYLGNRDAHNTYIQLLAENGIIGSIPFLGFFVLQLFRAYKCVKISKKYIKQKNNFLYVENGPLCLFLNVFVLIYMAITTFFYSQNLYIYYLLVCAMTTAEYRRLKQVHMREIKWFQKDLGKQGKFVKNTG